MAVKRTDTKPPAIWKKHKRKPLSPDQPFMEKWDILMLVLLVYTALLTPFEVAFLTTELNSLFVVNRLVDLCFVCDMCLNFFTQYRSEDGIWVADFWLIRRHYLKGWFTIDLVSILPFDSLSMASRRFILIICAANSLFLFRPLTLKP